MTAKPLLYILFACFCCISISAAGQANCPANLDFEQGNLNNWEFYTGNCCPLNAATASGAVAGRHELMTGTAVDPYGNFPVVPPGGGSFALKLGNDINGAEAERARYYIQVPNNPNAIYTVLYSYAVVFEDPGHPLSEQPRFEVEVYDSATGNPVPCNQFTFVSASGLPGFQSTNNGRVLYKPWSTSSIDLSQMAGRTVAIDFSTADCGYGGHFGYAYLDVACNFFQSYDIYCPSLNTITLDAPPGFETYEWYDANFSTQLGTGQNLTLPAPPSSTRFAVILQPYVGFGCPDTLFTDFKIENMEVDVTLDTTLCMGQVVQLNSGTNSTNGPYTYSWTPPTALSCTNCDMPNCSATDPVTKYYVTITDRDGCTATDSVVVKVDSNVFTDLVSGDTFCSHIDVPILNDEINPITTDYRWSLPEGSARITSGEGTDSINAQWYSPGVKKVKIEVINGMCVLEDSTEIYINPSPIAEFDVQKDVCVGEFIFLKPYEQETMAGYHWDIEEHNIQDTTYNPAIRLSWNTPGEKRIFLRVMNEYGCEDMIEKYTGTHTYPDATIQRVDVNNMCYGKNFTLATAEGDRYRYAWYPPQYFSSNGRPEVTGRAEVTGHVYLDVTNNFGCKSTDSVFINAESCCDIFMPDAFTPNGDGLNDTYWSPDLYKHRLVNFVIANRRGQIVYQTETPGEGWDGTHNGKPVGLDTYHYMIKFMCREEELVEKKGNFILLR